MLQFGRHRYKLVTRQPMGDADQTSALGSHSLSKTYAGCVRPVQLYKYKYKYKYLILMPV